MLLPLVRIKTMSDPNNPFSGLLGSSEVKTTVQDLSYNNGNNLGVNSKNPEDDDAVLVNNIVESVFHFTINPKAVQDHSAADKQLVYLEELAEAIRPRVYIDLEALEQALFERLLLPDIGSCVIPKTTVFMEHVVQKEVFPYLFSSLQNLQNYSQSNVVLIKNAAERMKELIYRNAVTALKQPMLFEGQDFPKQLVELLQHIDPLSHTFFTDVVKAFMSDGDDSQLREAILPVLQRIHKDIIKANLINLPIYILPSIQLFASNGLLASILLDACEPKAQPTIGRLYQDSVLGALLGLSVLPRSSLTLGQFFDNPMDQSATMLMESSVWNASRHLVNSLHKIFLALLKVSPRAKDRTLGWIGACLRANVGRGKLWNVQAGEISVNCVSDGFMVNLGAVLLQLCQPFCASNEDPKALKVDPTYGAVTPEQCASKSVHLDCLHSETCLLPPKETEDGEPIPRPTADTYSFVTECFFMTHKCIDLGVRVVGEKLWRASQELAQAQRALADVAASAQHALIEPLRQRAQILMTKYLCLRCALLEPDALSNLHRLQAVTATWLVQVAIRPDPTEPQASYAPVTMLPVELPLELPGPDTLRCIPEFVLENIVVLVTLSRRAAGLGGPGGAAGGVAGSDAEQAQLLPPALTLVLVFMGDARRTYNPHLRARLAECLEAMLPSHPDEQIQLSSLASFYREQLFKEHPHRKQLMPALLDVFVGIEMTEQFEQKFSYRRPMYLVMEHLWELQEHRDQLTRLAEEAEANMEAVRAPIFLRFVNLLMNDAIFLLDEALANMAELRTMQAQQESGAWASLPAQEREQTLGLMSHTGMLARSKNILGRDTVRTLVRLTELAPRVFCHPTLVERIASMLNYFLLSLVGPNKKNFKVKDMREYEFEPAATVLDICRMYVQLGDSERFCIAVSDDGRSYSPQLFSLAEAVLVRIGGGSLIGSLRQVAERVAVLAEQRQRDEELLCGAPDEFLDPIMSTLMMDPVVLPSSHATVDRTTIARHLLSDPSDPFNRSPLTMDQVTSNVELRERIHAWVDEQKAKRAQSTSQQNTQA